MTVIITKPEPSCPDCGAKMVLLAGRRVKTMITFGMTMTDPQPCYNPAMKNFTKAARDVWDFIVYFWDAVWEITQATIRFLFGLYN